jgi:endonuclease YncB( thermonuclease family)
MTPEELESLKNATKSISEFSLENNKVLCKIVDVYDGDSVKAVFYTFGKLHKWSVRLKGINTPELRPSRKLENRNEIIQHAKESRDHLKKLFEENNNLVYILCDDFGKYGRLIGTFFIDENTSDFESSINYKMIEDGYAKIY